MPKFPRKGGVIILSKLGIFSYMCVVCRLAEDRDGLVLRASHPPNWGRDRVVSELRFFLFLLEQSVLGWDFSHHYESRRNFD